MPCPLRSQWRVQTWNAKRADRCSIVGGSLRLRLAGRGVAGVAPAATRTRSRRAQARNPRAARRRRIARAAARARCRPGTTPRGPFHRSLEVHGRHRSVAGTGAWACGRASSGRDTTDARKSKAALDGGTACERGQSVALSVFRAIQPRRGCPAHGVPARLAHGNRQEPATTERRRRRRSCTTCWLQFRQHVQRRIHPPCRSAANALCARDDGIFDSRSAGGVMLSAHAANLVSPQIPRSSDSIPYGATCA